MCVPACDAEGQHTTDAHNEMSRPREGPPQAREIGRPSCRARWKKVLGCCLTGEPRRLRAPPGCPSRIRSVPRSSIRRLASRSTHGSVQRSARIHSSVKSFTFVSGQFTGWKLLIDAGMMWQQCVVPTENRSGGKALRLQTLRSTCPVSKHRNPSRMRACECSLSAKW